MKLFNAIAAAAVIGTSFIAVNPAEAGSRWVKVSSSSRYTGYATGLQRRGSIATYQRKVVPTARDEDSWTTTIQMDCNNWITRGKYSDGWGPWADVLPDTLAASELEAVCR